MRPSGLGFKCDYCGAVVVPQQGDDGVRVLDDVSGQQCPVCEVALKNAVLAGCSIEYCVQCRGMLVSMEEFGTLTAALRAQPVAGGVAPAPDAQDMERKIQCPKCHREMENHFFCGPGHVDMDSCENCEVNWMDAGEMERIAHAVDSFAESGY